MHNGEAFYVSQKYYPATVVVERPWVAVVDEFTGEPVETVDEWAVEPPAAVDEWDEPADAVWAETDDRGNSVGGGGGCEGYTSGAVDSEAENQHQVHKHGQSKNARKVCQST